jgi:hypothetical protein
MNEKYLSPLLIWALYKMAVKNLSRLFNAKRSWESELNEDLYVSLMNDSKEINIKMS